MCCVGAHCSAESAAKMLLDEARYSSACPERRLRRATRWYAGADLLDGNTAHHAVPIVVRAAQIVGPRLMRRQKKILDVAGLHHDLGMLAIENLGIVDGDTGEKCRCRDLVGFLAVVFHVQAIMHVALEGQMIGYEPVVDHEKVERDRLRIGSRYRRGNNDCHRRQQKRFGEDSKHNRHLPCQHRRRRPAHVNCHGERPRRPSNLKSVEKSRIVHVKRQAQCAAAETRPLCTRRTIISTMGIMIAATIAQSWKTSIYARIVACVWMR